jgi:hypothetical protein
MADGEAELRQERQVLRVDGRCLDGAFGNLRVELGRPPGQHARHAGVPRTGGITSRHLEPEKPLGRVVVLDGLLNDPSVLHGMDRAPVRDLGDAQSTA